MESLKNGDISTVVAIALELSVDAAVVIFGDVDGQVQSDIWESGFPGGNSWIALADLWRDGVSKLPKS